MKQDAPIFVVKNSISYPVEKYQELDRPFHFETSEGKRFNVGENDIPVFFVRKRMKVVGGKCVDKWIHRYCVGSLKNDTLQETHWIYPDGHYDQPNKEKLSIKKEDD